MENLIIPILLVVVGAFLAVFFQKLYAYVIARRQTRGELEEQQQFEHERRQQETKSALEQYLDQVIAAHEKIQLYGFVSPANTPVRLVDTFVSVRLTKTPHGQSKAKTRDFDIEEYSRWEERVLSPREVVQEVLKNGRSLLILGAPGSGKTTLLKFFVVCCANPTWRTEKLKLNRPLIPLLVELTQINPSLPFVKALDRWAKNRNLELNEERLITWLKDPGCLVLLDALDEIPDVQRRVQTCIWIDNAIAAFTNSYFIVSTRHAGYYDVPEVNLQQVDFEAEMKGLNDEQKRIFLKNWFNGRLQDVGAGGTVGPATKRVRSRGR